MPTKKQHYVPQFYLERFAVNDGQLFVYDKANGHTFSSRPKDIGHENHFLSVPELDGERGSGAFFERFFGGIEGAAASAIKDVLHRLDLGMTEVIMPESRQALALYLAYQRLRTREARQQLTQMHDVMDEALRQVREEGTPEFKNWCDDALSDRRDVEVEHSRHLLNPELIAELSMVLLKHVWMVNAAPSDMPLYTSDHPLTLYTHEPRPLRGSGPATYGVELEFALTPGYLMILMDRKWLQINLPRLIGLDGRLGISLIPDSITFQRSLHVQQSNRFVYCSRDDFDLAGEMCAAHPELASPGRKRVESNLPKRDDREKSP